MAKSKTTATPEVRHKRRSAADQEAVTRYLILGGVISVILIAAGIIAFGWYQTQIKPLGKTVLQVGSMKYSLGALERRMDVMYEENPSFYSGRRIFELPSDAIDQLTTEAKVLQGAGQLELSISDEEFAAEIKDQGNVSQDAAADVYAAAYADLVEQSGLHQGEFQNLVKAQLLQEKLSGYFLFTAQPSEAMVTANYGFAETQEEADELVSRVRAGEDFEAVGEEISADSTGTLDWTPRGGSAFLPDEVQDYLFDAAVPGEIGDPIEVDGLFYIVQLTERDPDRALDENTRRIAGERDKREWLEGLDITVVESLSEDDEIKAIEDII